MERRKRGRKALPKGEKKSKMFPLWLKEKEYEVLVSFSRKKGYRYLSAFFRDLIFERIKTEEQIENSEYQRTQSKDQQPQQEAQQEAQQELEIELYWAIIWFLSQQPVNWTTDELVGVLRDFPEEDVKYMLSSMNGYVIDYVPDKGWLIRPLEKVDKDEIRFE